MSRYVIRRLVQLIPIMWIISVIIFVLLQLTPGDPAAALEDNPNITAEDRARYEERLGLNDPLHIKYLKWSGAILQGDFQSSRTDRFIMRQVGQGDNRRAVYPYKNGGIEFGFQFLQSEVNDVILSVRAKITEFIRGKKHHHILFLYDTPSIAVLQHKALGVIHQGMGAHDGPCAGGLNGLMKSGFK